jgi:hypothetical protein
MGEQVIIYHAPGPAYAWRATVERDLAAHGWAPAVWWRTDLPATFNYLHVSSCGFGAIWDTVELDGEPNVARISVRRVTAEHPSEYAAPVWKPQTGAVSFVVITLATITAVAPVNDDHQAAHRVLPSRWSHQEL